MTALQSVPSKVSAFLSKCDASNEIYITHLDETPVSGKKGHFLSLFILNVVWSILLARRIIYGVSRYGIAFLYSRMMSRPAAPPSMPLTTLAGHVCVDIFLFFVLWPTVYDFVTGLAMLRLQHKFPHPEIVFRKPSSATVANIVVQPDVQRNAYIDEVLRRAIDPADYGMPWDEWLVDHRAMSAANALAKTGEIKPETWKLTVWMKMKDGWVTLEQWRKQSAQVTTGMMDLLKKKLEAMGKQDVFEQMIEVIHVKTIASDGSPLPVTDEVDNIIADIFKRNDLDLVQLTKEIGQEMAIPVDSPEIAASKSKSK
ncbi:hypothetical protein SERLA73DRAFT_176536 [Serpula lacrymans var. lacrymans S7.3]|uniref:Uncharacterized protein n=2 Tax=Serpula lacrymans var. lacrymans TaxID=341189 RepID=F8PN48_SERL3|nr:uncharacterized protein SERLADRAFT_459430 [Serpula lacrymans var. lacrymans S7.9]EGO03030.1 hypothetical protein SERLA73DRAFT_176536 [Serpula lacrymans var. lacrymans S7.3]EGO28709.1 hypothetical protein SERLADRAFT_459430 [Serpula lacrymans var. lacrymans S7.9]